MDKTSRAQRRFHRARMHTRATEMILEWYWYSERLTKEELHLAASRRRDHMCNCSCSGCGNPRHNKWNSLDDRITMQERRHKAKFVDEMVYLDHI